MMGVKSTRYIRTFIIVFVTLGSLALEIMASEINRVVFQSFLLAEDDTVQCYGRCGKNLKADSGLNQKFKVSRCEGRKVRFGCTPGYQIKIHVATLGKLNPELDICARKQSLNCAKDIATDVQTTCNSARRCVVDVTNDKLRNKCGNVKYLAMDIKYVCEIRPTTDVSTTIFPTTEIPTTTTTTTTQTTVITTTKTTSSKKVVKTKPISTVSYETSTEVETTTPLPLIITSSHSTRKHDQTVYNHTVIVAKHSKNTDMFWTLVAYTAISDSEFIKENKAHLWLVLLLSMFLGMVLCLCLFLDYCRRTKKKRDKHLTETKIELPESQPIESNERIQLINSKLAEGMNLKETLSNHTFVPCNHGGCNNNNCEEEEGDVFANMSITTPFIKKSLEHKLSALPPPPNDFSSESSSHDLLSPPVGFNGDKHHIPCLIVTSATPTGSSTNTLITPRKTVPRDKCNSEIAEIEEVYLEEQTLDDNLESSQYEYVEVGQYHACDEYSSGPQIHNSMAYHRTDNYVVPPNVQFASMNRRATSNNETSQEDTLIRTLDSKRMRKLNPKERAGLQKSKSLDEPKKKTYFTNNGNQYLARNPRRGRIHVMQRCEESLPPRSCNQKATYSDNEASRRRRRCDTEYKRSCGCHEQGTSLSDLYCTRCGKPEESHRNCHSSLTSNCQSSHDEDFGDNHRPLLSISDERIKNEEFRIEESGYQSHDTGTDSLCSSSFSTDQEDSRMFLPSTSNNVHNNGCRSKTCHNRCQATKHDPKLILVRDHNKSKVPRRSRRDDYTNADVHRHDNHTSNDVHSYDSSMDEASSRDSVKIFRRVRKQNTGDGGVNGFDEPCNCKCGITTPDTIRVDGIETS